MEDISDPLIFGLAEFIPFRVRYESILIRMAKSRVELKMARTQKGYMEVAKEMAELVAEYKELNGIFMSIQSQIDEHLNEILAPYQSSQASQSSSPRSSK